MPIDQRNNELKAGTEWVNTKGMIRVDYWGSYFSNDIQTLTWDNPIRATDFTNGLLPPLGRQVKRAERKPALARRALADLDGWLAALAKAA